ncbi:ATP-binding protein [Adlercreutzia sp. ZJ138]|uniref:ATP-binding protein n=1 Tax=Adlercreutzia sp. ZJ138 TaxID=2709405 RepID=UPI0013EBBA10|nr:MoxR family ATPase [Adlercreutzia sp. ZJ138]
MNIEQATEQIRSAITAYLSKDEHGLYRIPFHMQRPIIMFGPPGVGKTAIVSQVAQELDINFVSYSITHHTRQSALGLPFISSEEFDGENCRVSQYTMSEIIAAVHQARRTSGVDEGILFLDEVNCVSETLAPAMLQFLQYKTFGMHRLPEGWIIVTAGNPPEYNRAAREFDPATLDRLKRIDIEPDVTVWQDYAAAHGVHPAITTFLDAKPGSFYKVRAGAKGAKLVTARGWEDLSRMLQAYEAESLIVNAELIRQYLQDDDTAHEFFAYYELFRAYRDDYRIPDILSGAFDDTIRDRARAARFDERITLVGLLTDALSTRVHGAMELESALRLVRADLMELKGTLVGDEAALALRKRASSVRGECETGNRANSEPGDRRVVKALRVSVLNMAADAADEATRTGSARFDAAKEVFNSQVKRCDSLLQRAISSVDSVFSFLDTTFGEDSQESLMMVAKLSADPLLVRMVSEHGCESYLRHNKSLLFTERGLDLLKQADNLA